MSAHDTTSPVVASNQDPASICPECGAPLPLDGTRCPHCSSGFAAWGRSRTVFLSLAALLLVPMFTITGVVVRLFHSRQVAIAADWERGGTVNLQTGHAQVAIEDFRNALTYSPANSRLQLELAEALAAQGQLEEAQNYLFNLRNSDPENAMIDLEMARISSRQGDVGAAVSFYHDAAFGQWPAEAHRNRIATRKELIDFLLKHSRQAQARAEALSMAADDPADPAIDNAAAAFLSQAGDAESALDEYQHVLRLAPANVEALIGAGNAALATYNFSDADRYFSRAILRGAKDPQITANRDVAAAAAQLDPFDPRLTERERQTRILGIFTAAEQRAKACFPAPLTGGPSLPGNLQPLAAERSALPPKLNLSIFNAHPDYADQALRWAFAVEQAIPSQCADTPDDRAIKIIAAKNAQG